MFKMFGMLQHVHLYMFGMLQQPSEGKLTTQSSLLVIGFNK